MAVLLFLAGVASWLFAIMVYSIAASAIHEILAAVIALGGTVAIGCAAIVDAVNSLARHTVIKRSDIRVCPHCAEPVQAVDLVCKHCGRDLPDPKPKEVQPWEHV